jgi:hypothetical protein
MFAVETDHMCLGKAKEAPLYGIGKLGISSKPQ